MQKDNSSQKAFDVVSYRLFFLVFYLGGIQSGFVKTVVNEIITHTVRFIAHICDEFGVVLLIFAKKLL